MTAWHRSVIDRYGMKRAAIAVFVFSTAVICIVAPVFLQCPPHRQQHDKIAIEKDDTGQNEASYVPERSVSFNASDCFVGCSNTNASISMPAGKTELACLSAALRKDPERYGVRPYREFAGLDDNLLNQTLRGRRIYLLGDSTTRYLFCWLKEVFAGVNSNSPNLARLSSMDLKDANALIRPQGLRIPKCHDKVPSLYESDNDGTYIRWGPIHTQSQCSFENIYTAIRDIRPEVIVANSGLHWLHFEGQGRNVIRCTIERWVNYEDWMEEVVKVAESIEAKELLFKTTNHICDEKYVGDYAMATRLYREGSKTTRNRCVALMKKQQANVSDANIKSYCTEGTFDSVGVCHLNERLRRFVDQRKHDAKVKLRVFNDHDIFNCSYTEMIDGRHYRGLNLLRIRLLGNYLNM